VRLRGKESRHQNSLLKIFIRSLCSPSRLGNQQKAITVITESPNILPPAGQNNTEKEGEKKIIIIITTTITAAVASN
jgi:hypothetical protein